MPGAWLLAAGGGGKAAAGCEGEGHHSDSAHIPCCPVQPDRARHLLLQVALSAWSASRRCKNQVSVTHIIQLLRSMSSLCVLFTIPFLCGVAGVVLQCLCW